MQMQPAKLLRVLVALLAVLAAGSSLPAQLRNPSESATFNRLAIAAGKAAHERPATGVPQDWSHRHLVFSNPGTQENAQRHGKLAAWQKITNDPRYIIQEKLRTAGTKTLHRGGGQGPFGANTHAWQRNGKPIHRDWGEGFGTANPSAVSYPAKWSLDTSVASCTDDFVVYPTGAAGTGTQASIVAYFNLYSGCGAPVPAVDFAYNTGGTITGAISFSVDGTQVAFVQTSASVASVVLLKMEAAGSGTGTLGSPTAPTLASASGYATCTAPCMTMFTLFNSPDDSFSNPWVDYSSDTLFVGDDNGALHKITPVFNGTTGNPPAEITGVGTGWPAVLTPALGSPVFDPSTNLVFVGSSQGVFYAVGGGVDDVPTTVSGQIYGTSSVLGMAGNEIVDAPIVDPTAGMAYVFVQEDLGGNNGVFQFPLSFTSGSGTEVTVGASSGGELFLSGAFDNIYFNGESLCSTSCSPSGNLYVGGNTEGPATLYQIPISSNVMGPPNIGPALETTSLGTLAGRSSPVTEFFNSNGVIASGSVAIAEDPAEWTAGGPRSVTIGSVTYTFVFTAPAPSTATDVQVSIVDSEGSSNDMNETAGNLLGAINNDPTQCEDPGCFGTGTVANPAVTGSQTTFSNIVTLTATNGGSAGDFTVTESGAGINVSPGNNGNSADFIFFSTLSVTGVAGCPTGCLLAFDVTTGATLTTGTAPAAALGIEATMGDNANGVVTGGIIIDNDQISSSLAGTSQIYFLSLDNSGLVTCGTSGTGVCATQASQVGLN